MFRRFSKSASRKGKTAYKFKFTFELANLTGIPAHVDHAALTFVRGAKSQTSAVVPVEECAAVWHDARASRLEFCVTLYKDSSGAFQTKEYALKAQGVTGAVDGATAANQHQRRKTFAKGVFDLASFASLDGVGVDADAELQYVPLESCSKGMPGTVAGLSVGCAWLRDAAPGEAPTADSNLPGSVRAGGGSEATELVFVGDAVAVKDASGTDDIVLPHPNGSVTVQSHHEQDLEGFVVPGEDDDDDDANETVQVFAFPDSRKSSDDSLDFSGASSRSDARSNDDEIRLTPVREEKSTPGRERDASFTEASRTNGSPDRTPSETNVANVAREIGAFVAREKIADESATKAPRSPETRFGISIGVSSKTGLFEDGDSSSLVRKEKEDSKTPGSSDEEKHTPARVLAQRATAPLRDEIDALRVALAEAVTRCALAESDAVEHETFVRSLKEELRVRFEEKAIVEERARAFETENARLRAAAEEYEKTIAAKDAAFAAAEARAAEEALSLSRETADAVSAVERATKESAAYRRKLEKAEAEIAAKAREVALEAEKAREVAQEAEKLRRLAEPASAARAKDELHAECVALRDALKQSELALKACEEAKKSAVAETETLRRSLVSPKEPSARRPALREANARDDDGVLVSARRDAVMRKLVEKLRCDLKQSEECAAKATEALAVETSARKDAEARAERLAARAKAKEHAERAEKTVEPNRTCSLLPW